MDNIKIEKKFYAAWHQMKQRCGNEKHKQYPNYGGREIYYWEGWEFFKYFKGDMYEDYIKSIKKNGIKNTTLDRIDNNKGYFKENCRWSTRQQQASNRRNTQFVVVGKKKLTLRQIADRTNLSIGYVCRLNREGVDFLKKYPERFR